jgi:serine/threonine protein kinase
MEHTTKYGIGTGGYRAPELMSYDKKTYTNRVDIWSMGCILYELAAGSRAFRDDGAVFHYLYSGKMMEVALDDTFDPDFIETTREYIIDMLQIEWSARPSASVLSKEFERQWQLAENSVQLSTITSSATLLGNQRNRTDPGDATEISRSLN